MILGIILNMLIDLKEEYINMILFQKQFKKLQAVIKNKAILED